jgi:hypothetical protein
MRPHKKIASYISETTKTYVAHVLGLVKSLWPKTNVEPLVDGMASDCSEEQFKDYLKKVKLVGHRIVESVE